MNTSLTIRILCLITLSISPITTLGQKIEIFEPTLLEVEYYKRMVTDTLDRKNDFKADYVRLRIGRTTSMFYSPKELSYDSLSYNQDLKTQVFLNASRNKISVTGPFKERLYKNYPAGKITVYNTFALMDWTYTEDWEKPTWALKDSVKNILDYNCQLATCFYRGRYWFAWYTMELPISEGPWKLCGLPGLILEAHDLLQDYSYTAVNIKFENIESVGIYDYSECDWTTTTRKRYLQTWHKEINRNQAAAMAQMFDVLKFKVEDKKPPHRNYDLEETDYHDK